MDRAALSSALGCCSAHCLLTCGSVVNVSVMCWSCLMWELTVCDNRAAAANRGMLRFRQGRRRTGSSVPQPKTRSGLTLTSHTHTHTLSSLCVMIRCSMSLLNANQFPDTFHRFRADPLLEVSCSRNGHILCDFSLLLLWLWSSSVSAEPPEDPTQTVVICGTFLIVLICCFLTAFVLSWPVSSGPQLFIKPT